MEVRQSHLTITISLLPNQDIRRKNNKKKPKRHPTNIGSILPRRTRLRLGTTRRRPETISSPHPHHQNPRLIKQPKTFNATARTNRPRKLRDSIRADIKAPGPIRTLRNALRDKEGEDVMILKGTLSLYLVDERRE